MDVVWSVIKLCALKGYDFENDTRCVGVMVFLEFRIPRSVVNLLQQTAFSTSFV
jgi:hypothetical protein